MSTKPTKPRRRTNIYVLDTEVRRVDAVAPLLSADPRYRGVRLSRTTLLRMAMLRGLDVIEAESGAQRSKRSTPAAGGDR